MLAGNQAFIAGIAASGTFHPARPDASADSRTLL
jgi:hypothetical protein